MSVEALDNVVSNTLGAVAGVIGVANPGEKGFVFCPAGVFAYRGKGVCGTVGSGRTDNA